jgi:hypothetical protein
VDDDRPGPVGFFKRVVKRRDLHEVRAGRCDQMDCFQVVDYMRILGPPMFFCVSPYPIGFNSARKGPIGC